ncbi:MAG: lipid A export permease/ATP-binding protein MsbA [Gammaproteobacteria bacterium]|jgi:subfamily B ATP-binding cassette protein MsbA|nr:lipid A export permease/ATP-binding protein MsbA [Chromatiales bacterium]MDP6675144.1 lipid A export permease/ATP-binding protein MsbA [Gammaproteobacteria bacterium]
MPTSSTGLTPAVVYRRLLDICLPYWKIFIIAAIAMVFYAITDTGFAFLIKNLMEYLDPEGLSDQELLIRRFLPVAILGLFLVRGLVAFLSAYCLGWIGRNVIKVLRGQAFDKFLGLPTSFFDSISAGEMLSRLTFNVEQVAEATSNVVTVLIRDTLTIICLLTYMTYLSPPLTGILLVTGPLMALVISILSKMFRRYSTRIQNSVGDVARITEEALQSHRIVKMFGGQKYESERFAEVNKKNMRLNMRLIVSRAGGDGVTNLVIAIGVASVIYFVMFEGFRPPAADLAGFITAMVFLLRPIRQITNINVSIQRGIAAGASIFELLDEPGEMDAGSCTVERAAGHIEFRAVGFTYSEQKGSVLRDITLEVQSGEMLAIVGRSGSGKSTLVSLLPRFYDPESGQILLDGRPLQEYQLANLRDQISLVSQEVVLFNDSIANNIAYGSLRDSTREQIVQAAQAAHVDEFTNEMPDGLATQVGDRGVLLSGGQRQRIAIARALLKNAPILILDEATAALDTASERHIQQAVEQLVLNRTTLVIAHRLSTVEGADRIIVMSEGRIIEVGNHAELLSQDGEYAQLTRMQFKDEVTR